MLSRHYLHGDKSESDQDSYFCSFCDYFLPVDHFNSETHSGKHRQRLALGRKGLANLTRHQRPSNAQNLFDAWPTESRPVKSKFYRWLQRQLDRDDPIGDLAADVKRDTSFPISTGSLRAIRAHLNSRRTCEEALQALEEAWVEFGPTTGRSGISLELRFEVFRLSDYACQICGATVADGAKLEVDHKIPVAKGGTNDMENLWALCFKCNRGKSASDL